jgi:hypothetical protein
MSLQPAFRASVQACITAAFCWTRQVTIRLAGREATVTAVCFVPSEPNHFQSWIPSRSALAVSLGVQNKTPQTLFESWDVCRSALPQVLLKNETRPEPPTSK